MRRSEHYACYCAAQTDFESAFPNSRKAYVERGELRVETREIALGGGEHAEYLLMTTR